MSSRLIAPLCAVPLLLGGCATHLVPAGPAIEPAVATSDAFVMSDGTRLGYRVWAPEGPPTAIIVALHGMNDSRDAFEVPAPAFAAAGIEVIAPDLRGFGQTAQRGYWPGTRTLVSDVRQIATLTHAAHPGTKLYLMGESMGGAILMCLAASPDPPPVAGYILVAPAVWGRSEMNVFERVGLWFMSNTVPGMTATGAIVKVKASDNRAAIYRLSTDPLTIHDTRWDTVKGLVDLMDAALADAGRVRGPALFLYGGKDELIPKRATAAAWRTISADVRVAYYPRDYHLMLRDLERAGPIGDILHWIENRDGALPSGAGSAAETWLERRAPTMLGAKTNDLAREPPG